MKLLTKVSKGVAFGDVSNQAVRNLLTEISKSLRGVFTEQEMEDTLNAFDWKCPYTGRDLRKSLEDGDGSYATDHIYPQNREWCGLNVKGNLVIVDKQANLAKRDQDIESFLLTDTKVLTDVDEQGLSRAERLQKIQDFQKACGYDPEKVRKVVSPLLKSRYDNVRAEQEKCIDDALTLLDGVGIHPLSKPVTPVSAATPSTPAKARKTTPLFFHPADEKLFKDELLKSRKAHFVLTYDSGAVKQTSWDASDFKGSSNLRGNIQSKTFWRNRNKEGLIKVEAFID